MSTLPPSLASNPAIDTWVRIDAEGTITVFTGKVELGQGILSAVARIAAEELDVSLDRVRVWSADTMTGPVEALTSGSLSLEQSGTAVRQAAAEARAHLLSLAAAELDASPADLRVEDGRVVSPAGETDYWRLLGGGRFGFAATGEVEPKPHAEHRIVGRPGARLDLPGIVTGTTRYVQDLAGPGVLHGRVVRPPSAEARLADVDEERARGLPGVVAVVRDGSFLGVVAEREEQADRAAAVLRSAARWTEHGTLPPQRGLHEWLRAQPAESFLVVGGTPVRQSPGPIEVPADAAQTVAASYTRPYVMHGSIGPSAALAQWREGSLHVSSSTQGIFMLRDALGAAFDLPPASVVVTHVVGAGCYGHNGSDDAALDAALLARAVPGRPVLLRWTREDEHAWEPYGPAGVVDLQASLDRGGRVVAWSHESRSNTHVGRPMPGTGAVHLLASRHREGAPPPAPPQPRLEHHVGIHRNADPLYAFPRRRIVKTFVERTPIRVSSLRSLGAYANVFAIESFMDELAGAAGADPLEFRLRHLEDERGRAVLEAAAERAGWPGRGLGLAFARYKNRAAYAAVVMAVRVDDATAQIHLDRAVIAADAGEIVDPHGLTNQLEGGVLQSASWTLKEQVSFDETRITSVDWETYPILTFEEVPELETVLLDRPGLPYLGAGEATQGPAAAAIANAVYAATGLRVRDLPLTPERLRAAAAAL